MSGLKSLLAMMALATLLVSCHSDEVEKHQYSRNQILNVASSMKVMDLGDDFPMGSSTRLTVDGDFLIFKDYSFANKMIHLFDKKSFRHLVSTGKVGQGPGEIISLGAVYVNETRDKLYVSDLGHYCVYSYDIDSLMADPDYLPYVRYRLDKSLFPASFIYLSDTLSYGTFIQPIDNKTIKRITGKWNMKTGEVKLMEYLQPDVKDKQTNIAYSRLHDTLVEGHGRADLISIFDGDLNLKHNVYGPNWNDGDKKLLSFWPLVTYKNYIIAAYAGFDYSESRLPTKLHVFKLNGDYVKTLETGHQIHYLSADEDENRLYFSLYDVIQFAYLDMKGILN